MREKVWLVKVKRYGGGESVIGTYYDQKTAQDQAAAYNKGYQSDAAYVEQWQPGRLDWPLR